MNQINLFDISLFEFECDSILTDIVYNEIVELDKTNKIFWNTTRGDNPGNAGYLNKETTKFYYHMQLYDWFNSCIESVSKNLFKRKQIICDTWITKHNFLEYSDFHKHSFSVLSGVFYFNQGSPIEFQMQHPWLNNLNFFYPEDTTIIKSSYTPSAGKLILFPSNLQHKVSVNKNKETRYSLVFNTFFDGELCSHHTGKLNISTSNVKNSII
jgi:hypothetical protein